MDLNAILRELIAKINYWLYEITRNFYVNRGGSYGR